MRTWRRLRRRPRALASAALLVLVTLAALAAPLWPFSPTAQRLRATLQPPGTPAIRADGEPGAGLAARHWLGTDQLGRDLVARVLYGARTSLAVGAIALLIAMGVGTLLGLLAGYYGGVVDAVVTGLTETLMTLPFILLAIAVIAAVGASPTVVVLTLGFTGWVSFAKLMRARAFELRREPFVLAARALGARDAGTLARHVLPNVTPFLIVDATLQLGVLILAEAGLSFLGLGIQPPTPTWGGILAEGQVFVAVAPWISVAPGVALLVTVLAINFLGDALRDALAPGG